VVDLPSKWWSSRRQKYGRSATLLTLPTSALARSA
jgi:hypothetical protein